MSCGNALHERNHREGDHPVPFRTRQLSPSSPKVLRWSPWEDRTLCSCRAFALPGVFQAPHLFIDSLGGELNWEISKELYLDVGDLRPFLLIGRDMIRGPVQINQFNLQAWRLRWVLSSTRIGRTIGPGLERKAVCCLVGG